MKCIPGPTNKADSLLRLTQQKGQTAETRNVAEEYIRFVAQNTAPRASPIKDIEQESNANDELDEVRHRIATGNWNEVPPEYKAVRNELTELGKLVVRGTRIVIPESLRKRTIGLAHEGHKGIIKAKARLHKKCVVARHRQTD